MAINTALLVAAPILQDYFSDNATDAAMSAGVITCYKDNSRTTLKNWYYQTGTPGAYTYTQLPNPLTLSAAGTITDAMGNDTIPFWYPYSELDNETFEPYYVTVDNSNGQRQFTRQNFPFVPQQPSGIESPTFRNLIVNNVFWRNTGSMTLTNTQSAVLAPSQHDGFLSDMSDIQFKKNANGSTDVATFTQFPNNSANRLIGDATPEFYLNMTCGNSGTSETTKYVQIPICLHVDNLSDYPTASVTIWTQNVGGAANNTITLTLFQYLGSGATSPVAAPIVTIKPSSTWQKTIARFAFPAATLPTGGAGDDGWFLQIGFPVGVTYNMNIAKPSVYLSTTVPSDDFDTYEYVSATIDSPRTGDVRASVNNFSPFGWVAMNDQTIGSAASGSTARANIDTWPLFYTIWNMLGPIVNRNTYIPIFDSTGAPSTYGANAISDFNANKRLSLTKMLGRVMMGSLNDGVGGFQGQVYTRSGNNLTMTSSAQFFPGAPVQLTSTGTPPTGLAVGTTYYAIIIDGSNIALATTYANAIAGIEITLSSNGTGTNNVFTYLNGTITGQFAHTLLSADGLSRSELPDPITTTASVFSAASGTNATIASNSAHGAGTVSTANGNTPFNIVQPATFYNMFMKL